MKKYLIIEKKGSFDILQIKTFTGSIVSVSDFVKILGSLKIFAAQVNLTPVAPLPVIPPNRHWNCSSNKVAHTKAETATSEIHKELYGQNQKTNCGALVCVSPDCYAYVQGHACVCATAAVCVHACSQSNEWQGDNGRLAPCF